MVDSEGTICLTLVYMQPFHFNNTSALIYMQNIRKIFRKVGTNFILQISRYLHTLSFKCIFRCAALFIIWLLCFARLIAIERISQTSNKNCGFVPAIMKPNPAICTTGGKKKPPSFPLAVKLRVQLPHNKWSILVCLVLRAYPDARE